MSETPVESVTPVKEWQHEHSSQLLAAKDAGFEEAYLQRLRSLREVAKDWMTGGVPVAIARYELLKRLWLEFFAEDMNSICPYKDPAPDKLKFRIPTARAIDDVPESADIFANRQTYLSPYGQLRLVPEEYDPIPQYFGGYPPPPCLEPRIPSEPRRKGPRAPSPNPDLLTSPYTPSKTLSLPLRPHKVDPRAIQWQAGVKNDGFQTEVQAEDLTTAEARAAPAREYLTPTVHKNKIERDRDSLRHSGNVDANIQPSNPGEENIHGQTEENEKGRDGQDKGEKEERHQEEGKKQKKKYASRKLDPKEDELDFSAEHELDYGE